MGARLTFTETQRADVRRQLMYALPAIIAGGVAWLIFTILGETPLVRASGLALVIAGMALVLRPMGSIFAVLGALALAICPAFWSQTGGTEFFDTTMFIGAVVVAIILSVGIFAFTKSAAITVAAIVALFVIFYMVSSGVLLLDSRRSLRLTTLLSVALLYLMIDALLVSNPRPDAPPTGNLRSYHLIFLLAVFCLGVVNDPLFVLFTPALLLAIFLTRAILPLWSWAIFAVAIVYGGVEMVQIYASSNFWQMSSSYASEIQLQAPYLISDAWRNPLRWVDIINLLIGQFTIVGAVLSILGLARLSRWYPPVGVVTMFAFGAYAVFGILYYGGDREVLLLPLLMIQVIWMTYALSTFWQWFAKWRKRQNHAEATR